jgi:hypothetical protein
VHRVTRPKITALLQSESGKSRLDWKTLRVKAASTWKTETGNACTTAVDVNASPRITFPSPFPSPGGSLYTAVETRPFPAAASGEEATPTEVLGAARSYSKVKREAEILFKGPNHTSSELL